LTEGRGVFMSHRSWLCCNFASRVRPGNHEVDASRCTCRYIYSRDAFWRVCARHCHGVVQWSPDTRSRSLL